MLLNLNKKQIGILCKHFLFHFKLELYTLKTKKIWKFFFDIFLLRLKEYMIDLVYKLTLFSNVCIEFGSKLLNFISF